jgi:hypothetical protein
MEIDNPYKRQQISDSINRYTNFNSLEDLVDPKHNYRPVFYIKSSVPNIQMRELMEVADYYDAYMESISDPRRIYRHT